jgi:predicted Zn-dependent protease
MKRLLIVVLAAVLFLPSCATNPVTGKSEFNIVSEEQELAMGREAHEEILSEFDVYDEKPELNAMIDRIGKGIAARSARPNLPWTFTLLDTPMVNAMALPGGYIYVTRGILERMNSEDELAGVIGHEVAHVAARHSAKSISNATLVEIGLVAAAVIAGEENTERYGAIAIIGAGLLFTRYSRQQETQADLLGTQYMATAGYNPHGSENMLLGLQRLEGGRVSGIERYFMDHPDPKKRVEDVRREISTLQATDPTVADRAVDRAAFVRKLDGIITGNSTLETLIRDDVVYSRAHGIVARSPRGWTPTLESGGLFAFTHDDESEQMMYAHELEDDEDLDTELEKMGLEHDDSEVVRSRSGDRFTIDEWSGEEDGTRYVVHATQHDGVAFLHIGTKRNDALAELIESMRIGEDLDDVKPPRLRVRTAKRGDTWNEDLAHLNGFDFPSEIPAGVILKVRVP